MSKLKDLAVTLNQNLPANITTHIESRNQLIQYLVKIDEAEKALKAKKTEATEALKNNTQLFLDLHKQHGDFELGGITAKESGGYSTIVVDESKLPDSCFNRVVSLTKVKELIVAGVLPREVAYQKKSETVTVK